MEKKQKLWFLTLFSLILILSVYYITMPTESLAVSKNNESAEEKEVINVTEEDILTALQIEIDDERAALAAEYNEVLTNKETTTEEKNNAYSGLKELDKIKAKEEELENKLKEKFKLDSFIKIDSSSISVTIKKKEHDYSLANKIMRSLQEEFNEKMYISVKFKN